MTVKEMLDRIDSYEISQWAAYEQLHGPLNNAYSYNALASIEETLMLGNRIAGASAKSNPAPKPKHIKRPWELHEDPKHRNYKKQREVEEEDD